LGCEGIETEVVGNLEMGVRRFIVASRFALRDGLRRKERALCISFGTTEVMPCYLWDVDAVAWYGMKKDSVSL